MLQNIAFFSNKKGKEINWLSTLKVGEGENLLRVRTLLSVIDSKLKPTSIIRCVRREFGDQVLTFNLCCSHRQLAPFQEAPCRPLTSLAAERAKLQVTIFLPVETRKVVHDNTVIQVQNFVTKAPSRLTQLIIAVTHNIAVPECHQCKLVTVVQKYTKYKR